MKLTGVDLLRTRYGLMLQIARELGISRQSVSRWRVVPLEHVPEVARISGFTRHQIRPDFPWEEDDR